MIHDKLQRNSFVKMFFVKITLTKKYHLSHGCSRKQNEDPLHEVECKNQESNE